MIVISIVTKHNQVTEKSQVTSVYMVQIVTFHEEQKRTLKLYSMKKINTVMAYLIALFVSSVSSISSVICFGFFFTIWLKCF